MSSTIGHRSIRQFHFFVDENHKNDPPVPTFEHVVVKLVHTSATTRYPGAIDMGGPGPSFSVILRPHACARVELTRGVPTPF